MTCDDARTGWLAMESGELRGRRRAAVERHCADCPACAEQVAATARLLDAVRREARPDGPAVAVRERVEREAARAAESRRGWVFFPRSWATAAAAAAALALVVGGWWALTPAHDPQLEALREVQGILSIVYGTDDSPGGASDGSEPMQRVAADLLRMQGLALDGLTDPLAFGLEATDPQAHSSDEHPRTGCV